MRAPGVKKDEYESLGKSKSLLCMTPTGNCESQDESQVEGCDFHKQQQQVFSPGNKKNIKDSENHNLIDVIGLHFAK